MKKIIRNTILYGAVILFVASLVLPQSCANTTAAPAGGPVDSIPPLLTATIPDVNQSRISTTLKRVELQFNEYVKLVDPNKNIMLSPPPEKNPTLRTKGKGVVVDLKNELLPNTTYSLYFGNAIQDNNEGNPFPVFALSFSTGEKVDSLMYSGMVVDASTLLPIENATVLLHINPADTSLTKSLPVAVTRTDPYGYFVLRNLKDTLYSLFAITDQNNNYRYDPVSGEQVGFIGNEIIPQKKMFTYAPEIQPYFAKDTAGLLRRPAEGNVFLFKEASSRQYLRSYDRIRPRALELKFGAPNPQILKAVIPGMDSTQIIRQHNYYRDSLIWWLAAPSVPDTVYLHLTYMATDDSLNTLMPRTDTLRFTPFQEKEEEGQQDANNLNNLGRRGERQQAPPSVKPKRETMNMKVDVVPDVLMSKGFTVNFGDLPVDPDFTLTHMTRITPQEDTVPVTFSVSRDSLDLCLYYIFPNTYMEGTPYRFLIPTDVFTDINGFKNDSVITNFETLLSDDFGSLTLNIQNVFTPVIIDLMNEGRTQVLRTHHVLADSTVMIPYLKAGKYALRITGDTNGNGLWDTGNVIQKRQAEKVRIFRFPGGGSLLELAEKMELTQTLDIEQVLNQHVTLTPPARKR
ncbi:MAG: Ig-like domain-containing protein [Bacteroidales bacterium]